MHHVLMRQTPFCTGDLLKDEDKTNSGQCLKSWIMFAENHCANSQDAFSEISEIVSSLNIFEGVTSKRQVENVPHPSSQIESLSGTHSSVARVQYILYIQGEHINEQNVFFGCLVFSRQVSINLLRKNTYWTHKWTKCVLWLFSV